MIPAFAIAKKDIALLVRDPVAIFWAVLFPAVFALLFGAVLGRSTAPRVLVVVSDHAASPASSSLVSALGQAGCETRAASDDEGRASVRRGEAVAALSVPAGFPDEELELSLDPSRRIEGTVVRAAVSRALLGPGSRVRETALAVASATGHETALPAAILWGLIGCAGTFAVGIASERASGTLLRLRAAAIPRGSILLGKGLACLVACVVDATLLALFGRFALGVRIGSPVTLALAIAAAATCFSGVTLLAGTIGKTEQATGGAGWGALLLLAMLGGAMIPISAMPGWMQAMGDFTPVRWGIVALEAATWRGLPPEDVVRPSLRLLALGGVTLALSLLVFSREAA